MSEISKWERAGKIAHQVLDRSLDIVEPGMPLIEIVEKLEDLIITLGGKPAFPVNISINHVAAHYSPRQRIRHH